MIYEDSFWRGISYEKGQEVVWGLETQVPWGYQLNNWDYKG